MIVNEIYVRPIDHNGRLIYECMYGAAVILTCARYPTSEQIAGALDAYREACGRMDRNPNDPFGGAAA